MDEVFLRINGELHYLWRAVDQCGVVLDILVQDRRNATAAKRFFKRLLAELKWARRPRTAAAQERGVRQIRAGWSGWVVTMATGSTGRASSRVTWNRWISAARTRTASVMAN
jgi:hypothetical protein